ncbi:MAG: oligopeptide transporter, OPT family [Neisseriales bacterium]|nr:MAG: oligopeptide transporter, OPT family [Neisseriales bacterium]
MLLAAVMTAIFTASDVYLGLKIGLTSSSAIPAAVISMAVLSSFAGSNILENNMVQTQASAAGTQSRIIFALPALIMIGYWKNFSFLETTLIALAGGMLGVVFSIPLRRALVVNSQLPYPEGVAAAEILKVGSAIRESHTKNHTQSTDKPRDIQDILSGSLFAAIINLLTTGLQLLSGSCAYWIHTSYGGMFQLSAGFSLAMTGAGYLIGATTGLSIFIGLLLGWGIILPYLTATTPVPTNFSSNLPAFAMMLWQTKARLIGAGVMTVGALWTIIALFKPLMDGLQTSFRAKRKTDAIHNIRTEQDLSSSTMIGIITIALIILTGAFYCFAADISTNPTKLVLLISSSILFTFVIGFLVASVCGYMAGVFGSSGSPISGIAIIAIMGASLLLLAVGHITGLTKTDAGIHFAMALAIFITSVIITIACIANDNLQDLNTGYLVGATPWRQQVALLIGCAIGSLVIAPIMQLVYQAYGFIGAMPRPNMDLSQALIAPQATLVSIIATGIFNGTIAWKMIYIGVGMGVVLLFIDHLLKKFTRFHLPPLAVGIGLYLPPSVEMPLVIGAVLGCLIDYILRKKLPSNDTQSAIRIKQVNRRGTLLASGLIVGESIVGVFMAIIIVASVAQGGSDAPLSLLPYLGGDTYRPIAEWLGLSVFIISCIIFVRKIIVIK